MDSMAEEQRLKHMCKFCSKSFPSGRSLGGHMRSHLINISSGEKLIKKKKLPPLTKTNEDNLICKECGKGFFSWKALFGHMKCHSVNVRNNSDSCNGSSDHHKPDMDSESDNPCRRKRSDRTIKRYNSNSSSLCTINVSPCISEIDLQEQEEVAISLIMLSRDVSNWGVMNPHSQSSENNSNSENMKLKITSPVEEKNLDNKESKLRKRKCIDLYDSHEFGVKKDHQCPICFKVFGSGQALGGHKRSHLIRDAKANNPAIVIKKEETVIRDFLDLNLPAPVEENDQLGLKPWLLLGLLST